MKKTLVILFALVATACGREGAPDNVGEQPIQDVEAPAQLEPEQLEIDSDKHILPPEEEEGEASPTATYSYRFAQTKWGECKDPITGNYSGYNCSNNRKISVMLDTFMDKYMKKCVDAGLAAQGGGKTAKFHVVHAGITGDPYHSPRSLHAENRAIDIKSLNVTLTSGKKRTIVYAGTTNRTFYKAFRSCWGQVLKQYNGCPYVSGGIAQTGSIGWENRDHQHHLHTSIPYCVSGRYGAYFMQR